MKPIRDIGAIRPSSVVYHSAFGFARVAKVDTDRVLLEWEESGENLPSRVPLEVVNRVYALCEPGGFFHRALNDFDGLSTAITSRPAEALALLLEELPGPQRPEDIREWIVGRRVMNDRAFAHWWKALEPVLHADDRFVVDAGQIALRRAAADGLLDRFDNPALQGGRRLDLAIQLRSQLPPEKFLEQVLLSWRTGTPQVRDLALTTVKREPAEKILAGLLVEGPDNLEALIHAIRRAGWEPGQITAALHQRLVDRVLQGIDDGGPLDNEGRLAATLSRWPSPVVADALLDVASASDGRRLLRATFAALPPRRAEVLALELLKDVVAGGDDDTAQWLAGEALGFALVGPEEMADRIEDDHPDLAVWYRESFRAVDGKAGLLEYDEPTDEATLQTAEVDLSNVVSSPIAIGELPPRSGASLLGLGLALARALAQVHKDGTVIQPSSRSVMVLPNETIEIVGSGEGSGSPRSLLEPPSLAGDVYAAGVLLIEAMLGRPWPRTIPPSRAIPYLRAVIPLIAPSALAPLDAALHPDPRQRPSDGLHWLALWQAAALTEETRVYSLRQANAKIRIGVDTHVGRMKLLLTQTNQDAVFVAAKGPLSLLIVCDGISTANAGSGDVASSIAAHVIANLWEQAIPRLATAGPAETKDFLDRALRAANNAVCDAALRFAGGDLEGRVPMGTTAIVAIANGNWISIAWLGDSRGYVVGPYGASLITFDENQAADRMKAWQLGATEQWDPAGFALVGYLGHFNDLQKSEALPAHHTAFTLVAGERVVLCTDGLTDYVGETHPEVAAVIAREILADADLDDAARRLVWLANKGGGGDNLTCVVAALADD